MSEEYAITKNHALARRAFAQKEAFHRAQAQLRIEEKVRILVELQKLALTIKPDPRKRAWELDGKENR